jgi:hypothetical protein
VCLNATGNTAHTIGWDVQWKILLLGSLGVFLSDSRQLLEEYIEKDNNQLVPHPSKFIICHHPTTRLCVTETSLNISRTKPTTVLRFEAFVTTNGSSAFTAPQLLSR